MRRDPSEDLRVPEDATKPERQPERPDASAINACWQAEPEPGRGWRAWLARAAARVLAPRLEAQRRFNATQVQLDNELLRYLDERADALQHRCDRQLAEQRRRLDDVDARHRQLEAELLRHVRDLVTRIDLVLAESNRDRLALAFALEEARERLGRLEAALRREG